MARIGLVRRRADPADPIRDEGDPADEVGDDDPGVLGCNGITPAGGNLGLPAVGDGVPPSCLLLPLLGLKLGM